MKNKLTAIKKLLVAAMLVAPLASFAQGGVSCNDVADFARSVMEGRQYGAPMRKMIERSNASSQEGLRAMNQGIIELAYSRPQFATDHHKRRMITEFENEFYGSCLKLKAAGMI